MKLGTKIVSATAIAVLVSTVVALFIQRAVIRDQGIELTRNTMRGAVLEAENVRESVGHFRETKSFDEPRLLAEMKSSNDLRSTSLYETIPVVGAWNAIQKLADREKYEFRIPARNARNSKNLPTADEEAILDAVAKPGVEEYFAVDEKAGKLLYARPIRLTQDCLSCHGNPANSPTHDGLDVVGKKMENWQAGEIRGAFLLKADIARIDKVVQAGMSRTIVWLLPTALLLMAIVFFLSRQLIVKPLNTVIHRLDTASHLTNESSNEIAAGSSSMSQGVNEQAASLEETSASIREVALRTKSNSEVAVKASEHSIEARAAAARGNDAMVEMSEAISKIEKSSREMATIIKDIDEIAFQTNLLALNAAVEAARAGDAGNGFAVVAKEVRSLAMRSAEAAKNTASMIDTSIQSTQNGVKIVDSVSKVLAEVNAASDRVNSLVAQITASSSEQNDGIGYVNTAVQQMNRITQMNASNATQSASSAKVLANQSDQLRIVVSDLKSLVGFDGKIDNTVEHESAAA